MCRSIKKLRGAQPPPTGADVRAAARQFIRKVSGFQKPAKKNEAAFENAVEDVARTTEKLLAFLTADQRSQ